LVVTKTKEERFCYLEEEAAIYDDMEESYYEQAEAFRDKTIDELMGSCKGKVLEIGCATGHLSLKLLGKMDSLVCLDVSISKIELAKKRTSGQPQFVRADMEHLPFRSSTFNLVISHYALHHAFNPGKAVSDSMNVTKEGGRLFYAVPRASDDHEERRRRIEEVRRGERLDAFSVSQFEEMLGEKGTITHSSEEDFPSQTWAGRVLFIDCMKKNSRNLH
jgi:ubiquinone/menaquinone biosynthesis C-methylase UbiE